MSSKRKCCRCDQEKDISQFDPVPYTNIPKTTCRACVKEMINLLKNVPGRVREPVPDKIKSPTRRMPEPLGKPGIDTWSDA